MNELFFSNEEFGKIRTVSIDNTPYFIGKDVAKILEYRNGSRDINRHVEKEDRTKKMLFDGKQNKETIIINESGLYSLIMSSKMPNAKKFKHWVTSEILPSIRKHSAYLTDRKIEDILTDPDTLIKLATELKEERIKSKKMKEKIENDYPKVYFSTCLELSDDSISVGDMAKILRQSGIRIGQNRLFEYLRRNGYLIKRKGKSYNIPTQKSMELGIFEIKEDVINKKNGEMKITKTPKITGKGQIYIMNKIKKGFEYLI